jgi:hypothetical protein
VAALERALAGRRQAQGQAVVSRHLSVCCQAGLRLVQAVVSMNMNLRVCFLR